MSKNNVLVISECKYSYVGLSVLLKKHYGAYDIRLFSDFMHGGAKAEKITKHDIALIFTSQNLEQSVNVIESPVSLHQQYNSKTRLLVFYDDERVVKLLSIRGFPSSWSPPVFRFIRCRKKSSGCWKAKNRAASECRKPASSARRKVT